MLELAHENLSVEEAIRLLNGEAAGGGPGEKSWFSDRRRRAPAWLRAATAKWLRDLPQTIRPVQLARRYPRVANDLCLLWRRPGLCERYMADLMMGRGGRRRVGLSEQAKAELSALIAYRAESLDARAGAAGRAADRPADGE